MGLGLGLGFGLGLGLWLGLAGTTLGYLNVHSLGSMKAKTEMVEMKRMPN